MIKLGKKTKNLKRGVLGRPETPQNEEKNVFKILSFSLGSELSRTIFIFDFQFQEVFLIFLKTFHIFIFRGYEMDPKIEKSTCLEEALRIGLGT